MNGERLDCPGRDDFSRPSLMQRVTEGAVMLIALTILAVFVRAAADVIGWPVLVGLVAGCVGGSWLYCRWANRERRPRFGWPPNMDLRAFERSEGHDRYWD